VPREITVTWDSTTSVTLEVWDGDGHHAGLEGGQLVNGIPGSSYSGEDPDGYGPLHFIDPSPVNNPIVWMVCYRSGPGAIVTVDDVYHGIYRGHVGPFDGGTALGFGIAIGHDC
jgi:hypothetical protein